MDIIDILETEIVRRITGALTSPGQMQPKVDVRLWSGQAGDDQMTHPYGCVTLIHKGSKFPQKPKNLGGMVSYSIEFELSLRSHALGESGLANPIVESDIAAGTSIYELLDDCKQALLGWRPEQAVGAIRICAEKLVPRRKDTWRYDMRFGVPMLHVATQQCPLGPWSTTSPNRCSISAPSLTQLNFIHL